MTTHRRPARARSLLLASLLASLLAVGLFSGAASADVYPPESEVIVGTPGAVITIRGTDWGPDTEVQVTYRDAEGDSASAAATVAADGTFVADLPIPEDAAEGPAEVSVQGTGSDGEPREQNPQVVVQADPGSDVASGTTVEVSGAAPDDPVPAENLSSTGLDLAIGLVAVSLLAAGGAALLAARRRRA